MKRKKPSPDRRGFTLIELLAVVAIILLLLSLLVPALSTVKEKAERTVCINNIRQLGRGMDSYAGDNNGLWPGADQWAYTKLSSTVGGIWAEWACYDAVSNGFIFPYVRDPRLYICPKFVRTQDINPAAASLTAYCSYVLNEFIQKPGSSWNLTNALQRSMVQKPAAQGVLGEEGLWACPPYGNWTINNMRLGSGAYSIGQPLGNPTAGRIDSVTDYHGPYAFDVEKGYSHVAFADGHVAPVYPKETKEVFNPELKKQNTGGF